MIGRPFRLSINRSFFFFYLVQTAISFKLAFYILRRRYRKPSAIAIGTSEGTPSGPNTLFVHRSRSIGCHFRRNPLKLTHPKCWTKILKRLRSVYSIALSASIPKCDCHAYVEQNLVQTRSHLQFAETALAQLIPSEQPSR